MWHLQTVSNTYWDSHFTMDILCPFGPLLHTHLSETTDYAKGTREVSSFSHFSPSRFCCSDSDFLMVWCS